MVKIETHVYGIYPKNEDLRIKLNRWERGRIDTAEISEKISREKEIYFDLVEKLNIGSFTDPLFNWYDILRLPAILSGAELGPLTRYKETNTFYRLPEFHKVSRITRDPSKFGEVSSNPPLPLYHGTGRRGFSAFLPSPVTMLRMAQIDENISKDTFIGQVAGNYAEICRKFGIKTITLFEALEYAPDDSLAFLNRLAEEFRIYLVTEGEIRDSNFSGVTRKLYSIITGDQDNAVISSKYCENPGLKLIDAHNTKLEDSSELKRKAGTIASAIGAEKIVITNSDYLDFLPRKIADRKLEILSKVGE